MIKDIPGFEGHYKATEDGKIFSIISNRFLVNTDKHGYVSIRLSKHGKVYCCKVHCLIAKTFIPKPQGTTEVNHKNGIKSDNRVENLEWMSRQQNILHSFRVLKRRKSEGASHPKSKLLLDLQTGIFYDSVKYAADAKGLTRHQVKSGIRQKGIYSNLIYA